MIDWILQLRVVARSLMRVPSYSLAVVLTLGLGIGAVTGVFTLISAILLDPLPYPDGEQLVLLRHKAPGLAFDQAAQSEASYLYYRANNRVFQNLGFYTENVVNVTGVASPERVDIAMVSLSLLSTMGARTIVGRVFTVDDGRSDEIPVLISAGLWRRVYGADPAIAGRMVSLNGRPRRVVGVMAPGFDFPRRETEIWYGADVDSARPSVSDWYYNTVARLRPGVSLHEAEADLNRMIPGLGEAFPAARTLINEGLRAEVVPLKDAIVGPARRALWLLFGGMILVLLTACANVANLLLVRAEHRQREVALRVALGASSGDLGRWFVSETLLLASAGGALGLLLASVMVKAVVQSGPRNIPRLEQVGFDFRVYAFALGIALLLGLALGLLPVFRKRGSLHVTLRSGGLGSTADRHRQHARAVLVSAQVALALALLIGAALLVQSFLRLRKAEPGFHANGVLTVELALPYTGYETYARNATFWQQAVERVRALPMVQSAGAATALPLVPFTTFSVQTDEQSEARAGTLPKATMSFITEGYLEAMRMKLVAGVYPRASSSGPEQVLISAGLARRLFPADNATGNRIRRAGDKTWNTIVGVVADVPGTAIGGEPLEVLYIPVLDQPVDTGLWPSHLTLVLRTAGNPLDHVGAVRAIVRSLDPNLPLARVRTMERIVADSMARTTLAMLLLLLAGASAFLLGSVGIYAVIAYTVTRRTRELGIRSALGARARHACALIVGQTARYVGAGVLEGLVIAVFSTRALRGLLYGVAPLDVRTIAAMVGAIALAALAASLGPALRAARVDPMTALKTE